jgi:hypothetical protein
METSLNPRHNIATLPYVNQGVKLLECIFESLKYLVDIENIENIFDKELESKIEERFQPFYEMKHKPDFHISKNDNNRLSKIVLTAYKNVQENSNSKLCIPSPLNVLYQMLTVPNEPQSVAYVIVFCRSLLREIFNIFPNISNTSECIDTFQN